MSNPTTSLSPYTTVLTIIILNPTTLAACCLRCISSFKASMPLKDMSTGIVSYSWTISYHSRTSKTLGLTSNTKVIEPVLT